MTSKQYLKRATDYKAERTQRGLTQAALAAILGLPQSTISSREHGKRVITKEAELAIKSLPGKGKK
jgi:transcriptional regulator with XRE-family HTH domain